MSGKATTAGAGAARGGRIECYVDIASYFSYIAVLQIFQYQDLLKQHGVEVEIYPMLIGAINAGAKNSPPWMVPAKRAYLAHDTRRSKQLVGLGRETQPPRDLMIAARTQTAMRALTYIRDKFPPAVYHAALLGLMRKFWTVAPGAKSAEEDQALRDLTSRDNVAAALVEIIVGDAETSGPKAERKLFSEAQVREIIQAAEAEAYKAALKDRVAEALGRGAFGAPWFWITPPASPSVSASAASSKAGKGQPVFGSDRWHVIFDILDLPYTRLALQPPPPPSANQHKL